MISNTYHKNIDNPIKNRNRNQMKIPSPKKNTYTIYYIDHNMDCVHAMKLVEKFVIPPLFVNCTEYKHKNKKEFLNEIETYLRFPYMLSFPIVFFDKRLLGGYTELILYYEKNQKTYYELSQLDQSWFHLSPPGFIIHSNRSRIICTINFFSYLR